MARRAAAALVVVFSVGLVHAAFYAVVFPSWAVEDEQQHVDYAWTIAHEGRVPHIDDHLAPSIVESIWATDRWSAYGFDPPPDETVEAMGLGGRSYMAYHPPGVYLAVAPVAVLVGDHAHALMYALRALSAVAAGVVCALAGLLAATLAGPDRARTAVLGAGLSVALLPSVAEAGGRFNTDIFAALAVVAGVLALQTWARRPSSRAAWVAGGVLAVAVLTRETTIVLVVPAVVAVVGVRRAGRLVPRELGAMVGPPLAALVVVLWSSWYSTGRLLGSQAFLDLFGRPFAVPTVGEAFAQLLDRAFLPYGEWGIPGVVAVGVALVLGVGVVRAGIRGLGVEAATAVGMLALQLLVAGNVVFSGLGTVTGRLLLPVYPVLIAVAVVGWLVDRRSTTSTTWTTWTTAWVVPAAVSVLAVWFAVADFLPTYF